MAASSRLSQWLKRVPYKHKRYKYHVVKYPPSAVKTTANITPTGKSASDIAAANKKFGKPRNYDWKKEYGEPMTWHHHVTRGRMQLIPRRVHQQTFPHVGGSKLWYNP